MAVKERSCIKPVYTITGTVVHGRGIGKHVGTPTANIEADEAAPLPETGVYASKILLDSQTYYGVTHVGARPTLDNDKTIAIETHLFDFDGDGGIPGCASAAELINFTRRLIQDRYNEEDIRKIWGGNFLRVMQQVQNFK